MQDIVYFTDGKNPPRRINVDELLNGESVDDVNELNLFHYIRNPATVSLNSVNETGGSLLSGTYYIALAYVDEDLTRTNYFVVSPPISVPHESRGAEERTSKSISLRFANLDFNYSALRIAVIPQYNGSFGTVEILPDVPIENHSLNIDYLYTGAEEHVEGNIDEILINRGYAETAKTLQQLDKSLYLGNITGHEDIGYQKYANNIKVELAEKSFDANDQSFADSEVSFNLKTYRRDETYAFYISFIRNDGSETPAYHIPGRESVFPELQNPEDSGAFSATQILDIYTISETVSPKTFHFYSHMEENTNMGYWRNENEFYPNTDDWEIWDVDSDGNGYYTGNHLSTANVRHHRFPNLRDKRHYSNGTIFLLGIKLKDVKIPKDIKDKVTGIRVHYARRTPDNKTVLDDSIYVRYYENKNNELPYFASSGFTDEIENSDWSHDDAVVAMFPFNMIRTNTPTAKVTHLNQQIAMEQDKTIDRITLFNYYTRHHGEYKLTDETKLAPVESMVHVPHDITNVTTSKFGFDQNLNNYGGKSAVMTSVDNSNSSLAHIEEGYVDEDDVIHFDTDLYHSSICSFKTNIYNSFDKQELVWTGFQDDNLDNYDPTKPDSSFQTTDIYGGDTFITRYAHIASQSFEHALFSGPISRFSILNLAYDFYCQSDDNIELRNVGDEQHQTYLPKSLSEFIERNNDLYAELEHIKTIGDIDVLTQKLDEEIEAHKNKLERPFSIHQDNFIGYSEDYSALARVKPTFPARKIRSQVIEHPTRVMRSQEETPDDVVDNYRIFLAEDYMDFPANRGEIIKLPKLNNVLGIHTKYSLFRTRGREQLSTSDVRAFIGSGDIFAVKPEELHNLDLGYGGLQQPNAAYSAEFGYLFADQRARRIYLLQEQLNDISSKGLSNWFFENLKYELEDYGFDPSRPIMPYMNILVTYDSKYRRFFITKRELTPTSSFIFQFEDDTITYDEDNNIFLVNGEPLQFEPNAYFEDNSWTISYVPEFEAWESWHDFHPDIVSRLDEDFVSVKDSSLYLHNDKDNIGVFYGSTFPMIYEIVDNREPHLSKRASNIVLTTVVKDENEQEIINETIDKFRIYNDYQDSGEIQVEYLDNARRTKRDWHFNKFRDILDATGNVDNNLPYYKRKRLEDKYHTVRFIYDNSDGNKLYILGSRVDAKESKR